MAKGPSKAPGSGPSASKVFDSSRFADQILNDLNVKDPWDQRVEFFKQFNALIDSQVSNRASFLLNLGEDPHNPTFKNLKAVSVPIIMKLFGLTEWPEDKAAWKKQAKKLTHKMRGLTHPDTSSGVIDPGVTQVCSFFESISTLVYDLPGEEYWDLMEQVDPIKAQTKKTKAKTAPDPDKAAADKEAADKEAADKEAADKEAADKAAADKAAADKAAADKEAADKAAADKAAADKAAADKKKTHKPAHGAAHESHLGRNIAIGVGGVALGAVGLTTYVGLKALGIAGRTAVGIAKAVPAVASGAGLVVAGTLNGAVAGVAEPFVEASAGGINAWNYLNQPNYSKMKAAKGWTSPFTWMGNGLKRTKNALQWTADKALRTTLAVPTAAAGLAWGTIGAIPTFVGVGLAGSEHGRFWSKNLVPSVFGGATGKAASESVSSASNVVELHPKEDHVKHDDHAHKKAA